MPRKSESPQLDFPRKNQFLHAVIISVLETCSRDREHAMRTDYLLSYLRAGGFRLRTHEFRAVLTDWDDETAVIDIAYGYGVYLVTTDDAFNQRMDEIKAYADRHRHRKELVQRAVVKWQDVGIQGLSDTLRGTLNITILKYDRLLKLADFMSKHACGRTKAVTSQRLEEELGPLASAEHDTISKMLDWNGLTSVWRYGLPIATLEDSYWFISTQKELDEYVNLLEDRAQKVDGRRRRLWRAYTTWKQRQELAAAPKPAPAKPATPPQRMEHIPEACDIDSADLLDKALDLLADSRIGAKGYARDAW